MFSRLAAGFVFLCGMLPAQTQKVEDLAAGKLLVMERDAPDPIFAKSVILLIHYDTDGVVGLMLNRASDVPLSRLRELEGTRQRADPAYAGGPVQLGVVTALVRASSAPPESMHVAADIYAVQTRKGLEAALKNSKGPADLRVYLGYCGWVIPQIKNEVRLGSWHIFEHGERFAFDSEPTTLWNRLIGRTGGTLALAPLPYRSPGLRFN